MVRLKGFQNLTTIDHARKTFFNAIEIKKPKTTLIDLEVSIGRVLASDIVAREDLPKFDRSAVDGYAVNAEDTIGASQFKPRVLQLVENGRIRRGQLMQIWTGHAVPEGVNAVIMLENTRKTNGRIEVWNTLTPNENVSRRGEDVSKGQIAVKSGTKLRPHHLGLIAALGVTRLEVFTKPKVGILATGNELVEIHRKPGKNQIYDSNTQVLSAFCLELGAEPVHLGIARDSSEEILERLKLGLKRAEAVVTSGGTSVGGSDLVPEAVGKIGKPSIIVHGIAMRPGMPTALYVVKGKPIIMLPGNPVAVMIGFEVFARPLICRMAGLSYEERRPILRARMVRKVVTNLGRKTFVRVRVFQKGKDFLAEPISSRGSSLISTMTKANGYVIASENREGLDREEIVLVHLFDTVEMVDALV